MLRRGDKAAGVVSAGRGIRIVSLTWDQAARRLSATSKVVAGDAYHPRLHVPRGYRLEQAEAPGLAVTAAAKGPLLTVDFTPKHDGTQDWAIVFE